MPPVLQAALKGALEDLAAAVASVAGTVTDVADGLAKQQPMALPQHSSSPRQSAADVQQALLTSAPAGAGAAKQHLVSSLSVLQKAVAAAVASSAEESRQKLALEQQLDRLQADLQQTAAAQQELQGQVADMQEQLTTAENAAQNAKAHLQQVRLRHTCACLAIFLEAMKRPHPCLVDVWRSNESCGAAVFVQVLSTSKHEQCGLASQLQAAKQQAEEARAAAESALRETKQAAAEAFAQAAQQLDQQQQQASGELQAAQQHVQQLQETLAELQQQLQAEVVCKQEVQQQLHDLHSLESDQQRQLRQLQQVAAEGRQQLQLLQAHNRQLASAASTRWVMHGNTLGVTPDS